MPPMAAWLRLLDVDVGSGVVDIELVVLVVDSLEGLPGRNKAEVEVPGAAVMVCNRVVTAGTTDVVVPMVGVGGVGEGKIILGYQVIQDVIVLRITPAPIDSSHPQLGLS